MATAPLNFKATNTFKRTLAWLFGVARSVKAGTIGASIDFEHFAILVTLPNNWQSLLQVTGT